MCSLRSTKRIMTRHIYSTIRRHLMLKIHYDDDFCYSLNRLMFSIALHTSHNSVAMCWEAFQGFSFRKIRVESMWEVFPSTSLLSTVLCRFESIDELWKNLFVCVQANVSNGRFRFSHFLSRFRFNRSIRKHSFRSVCSVVHLKFFLFLVPFNFN